MFNTTGITEQLNASATLRNCRLADSLVTVNGLDQHGFSSWLFCPGMSFNSLKKWWGDHGQRDFPHEGIDIGLYRGADAEIRRLDETSRVPAIGNGVVKTVFTDFLGQAVILEHETISTDKRRLLSIYAHTNPLPHIQVGVSVREGEILATLAETRSAKADIIPHLHFSLALASPALSYKAFVWNELLKPDQVCLLNPLQLIDFTHQMCDADHPYCLAL